MPAGRDLASSLPGGVGAPSAVGPQDGKAGDIQAQQDPAAPDVAFPKDAVLRAGASSAQNDPAKDAREPGRPDALTIRNPANRPLPSDRAADRQSDAEARKLMLEDGMPERDAGPREQPDLGDLEL